MRKVIPLLYCCTLIILTSWMNIPVVSAEEMNILSQRFVKDPITGIALNGIDPFSYILEGKPHAGSEKYEAIFGGAIWWFQNEGNRAAFLDAPKIYSPQYGGYRATAISRGFLAESRPNIWRLQENKLYLFHSAANKIAWKTNPTKMQKDAEEKRTILRTEVVP